MDAISYSEEGLVRAIEGYCDGTPEDNSEERRTQHLNIIMLHVHRGVTVDYSQLISKHLGPYLTHENSFVRARATLLLAELLERLPEMPMNEKMVSTLFTFFIDRIKSDYDSAPACLLALKSMMGNQSRKKLLLDLPSETYVKLVSTILTAHHIPAMGQSYRYRVYGIITMFINDSGGYFDKIRGMKDDLVNQFADAMDEEKDPRCLLLCMRICSFLLVELQVNSDTVQKVFDTTVVYFPITFRPPPNDPFGITTESLVEGLTSIFSSTPVMAQHVVPMLLDKLRLTSSEVSLAKIDSLKTLSVCIPAYGVYALSPYLDALRSAIFQHIVSPEEQAIADESLGVVQTMSRELAKSIPSSLETTIPASHPWSIFVEQLLELCAEEVGKSIDSMLGRASGRVAAAVASSSSLGLSRTMNRFMPYLSETINADAKDTLDGSPVTPTQRSAALDLLLLLLNGIDPDVDFPLQLNPMGPYVSGILDILMKEIVSNADNEMDLSSDENNQSSRERSNSVTKSVISARRLAVQGMEVLISRPPSPLLDNTSMRKVIQQLSKGMSDSAIRKPCLSALKKAASVNDECAAAVLTETVPRLLTQVEGDLNECIDLSWALNALAELCSIPAVFDDVVPQLLGLAIQKEQFIVRTGLMSILSKLGKIVQSNSGNPQAMQNCAKYSQDGDIGMVTKLLNALVNTPKEDSLNISASCAYIIRTIMQNVQAAEQDALALVVIELLVSKWKGQDEKVLSQLSMPVASVLGSLRSVDCCKKELEEVCAILLLLSTQKRQEISAPAADACSQTVAALINKCDMDVLRVFADKILYSGFTTDSDSLRGLVVSVEDKNETLQVRESALRSLIWMFKGLAMRSQSGELGDKLVALLKDEQESISLIAAEGFGTVIRPCEDVLNKESFAKESFLFKQRFFQQSFSKLSSSLQLGKKKGGCTDCSCESKCTTENEPLKEKDRSSFLYTLARLIEFVPKSVILDNLDNIVPILVLALASEKVEVKISALVSIRMLIGEVVEAIEPHLSTLIPLLLDLIGINQKSGKVVLKAADRARAVDCLSEFAKSLPYHLIHPYKKVVGRGIMPALDDRKRAVRKRAVECKNEWLTLQNH